jgi:hypothetical protein
MHLTIPLAPMTANVPTVAHRTAKGVDNEGPSAATLDWLDRKAAAMAETGRHRVRRSAPGVYIFY